MPRKSGVRLTDHPNMTLVVYCGRKTTTQQWEDENEKDVCSGVPFMIGSGSRTRFTLSAGQCLT